VAAEDLVAPVHPSDCPQLTTISNASTRSI